MNVNARDRCIGALVGLAVGDALGTALEFKPPGSFTPIDDMTGGGPFRPGRGFWTDDTLMALCLAESLVECGGFDAADQMSRYVRWHREGHLSSTGECFDIGVATSEALAAFERTGNPNSGSTHHRKAGNGSLMQLAPVPVFFRDDPQRAIELASESSRTTRGQWSPGELHPEIEQVAAGSFLRSEPPDIRGTGFVVRSLEAALWAFSRGEDFREATLLAVNLGDDADTTGAICGQIADAP